MRSKFKHISYLIKTKRLQKLMRQTELSRQLGYPDGQFINNLERGACGLPPKMMGLVSLHLDVPINELAHAMLKDYAATLDQAIEEQKTGETV